MNIRITCITLCMITTAVIRAQVNVPIIHELTFSAVAEDYNTYNDKHAPLSFLSGFSVIGDETLLAKNPIEVMFNPVNGVHRDECYLLRWDPVLRVWTKFSGNKLRVMREGSALYWLAGVVSPGTYALMKDLQVSGITTLNLPEGYKIERWKYVQSNVGVVCEGFSRATSVAIPLPAISPLAELSMRCRVDGNRLEEFGAVPAGTLIKRLWKDASQEDTSHRIEFASIPSH